jgi:hypothetical protein
MKQHKKLIIFILSAMIIMRIIAGLPTDAVGTLPIDYSQQTGENHD